MHAKIWLLSRSTAKEISIREEKIWCINVKVYQYINQSIWIRWLSKFESMFILYSNSFLQNFSFNLGLHLAYQHMYLFPYKPLLNLNCYYSINLASFFFKVSEHLDSLLKFWSWKSESLIRLRCWVIPDWNLQKVPYTWNTLLLQYLVSAGIFGQVPTLILGRVGARSCWKVPYSLDAALRLFKGLQVIGFSEFFGRVGDRDFLDRW